MSSSLFEQKLKQLEQLPVIDKYFTGQYPDQMSAEQLSAFHGESVKEIVKRAYEGSQFYRDKMDAAGVKPEDFTDISDLSKLPFLTKEELRGKPWVLLTCDKSEISVIQVSTGTTGGEEIYMMYTWEDYFYRELGPGYPNLFPVEKGDICVNALPYEMSAAGLAFHKTFMDGCQATVIPAGKGGAYSTPAKTIKMMRDLRPNVVITSPSWAIMLAEEAERQAFDLKSLGLKKMWLTGEGCSNAFRNRVEQIWGVKANFYYGSLECGALGIECDNHHGYHIPLAHSIIEIVDPKTDRVMEPGEIGEIVVTCPLRYDTPMLRYRTKDLGYIETSPCSCGVTLPRLFLRGRLVDQIQFQGVSLSPFYLEEFLLRNPEVGNWFEFVVDSSRPDRLKVRCELAPGVEPSETLADSLSSRMEFALGFPIDFEFVDKLPRPQGKTIRVVHV
jgi:phenylacetate-CoA ligase